MRKLTLLALTLAMLISTAACAGGSNDGAVTTNGTETGAVTTEAETTEAVTVDAVATDAVTADAVTTNAVPTDTVATDAVTTDAVTTDTVTTEAETTEKEIQFTEETMNGKNVYRVKRVAKKADIDWSEIPAAAIDNYAWVKCTEYKAYAQLVFAEDFGFVCKMTCEESDPAATYTNFNDPVCLDSCMEFFVILDGKSYLNLEANSIGTKCMGFGPNRNTRHNVGKRLEGGFAAIPEVGEDVWTLTYELPFDQIKIFYPKVSAETFVSGYEFSGNFYKTGGKDITGNEHYGMWNEVKTENPDFHQPTHFGIFIME